MEEDLEERQRNESSRGSGLLDDDDVDKSEAHGTHCSIGIETETILKAIKDFGNIIVDNGGEDEETLMMVMMMSALLMILIVVLFGGRYSRCYSR